MPHILDGADPLMGIHRAAGHRLAESAFKEWGIEAEERHLYGVERLIHPQLEEMMHAFKATSEQILHAKLIVGHALRSHYVDLCRSAPAVAVLKAQK